MYIMYSAQDDHVVEGLKEMLQMNFLKLLIFSHKFSSGTSILFISPTMNCQWLSNQWKGQVWNSLPYIPLMNFIQKWYILVLSNINNFQIHDMFKLEWDVLRPFGLYTMNIILKRKSNLHTCVTCKSKDTGISAILWGEKKNSPNLNLYLTSLTN